jgi:hypothetical protein
MGAWVGGGGGGDTFLSERCCYGDCRGSSGSAELKPFFGTRQHNSRVQAQ